VERRALLRLSSRMVRVEPGKGGLPGLGHFFYLLTQTSRTLFVSAHYALATCQPLKHLLERDRPGMGENSSVPGFVVYLKIIG
jgi:hypothetical protein